MKQLLIYYWKLYGAYNFKVYIKRKVLTELLSLGRKIELKYTLQTQQI